MHAVSPKLTDWLSQLNQLIRRLRDSGYKPTAIGAREALANVTRSLVSAGPDIAWVNDEIIHGRDYSVPVRIYHPAPGEARPVLLFLHGGGHTAGSVSVYDPISRRLAAATGHIVVVPEYRLAPENPYPAALHDAYAAARGVFAALSARQLPFLPSLSLIGDSAGAALAATVSARSQHDTALQIAAQVLIYPSLDYSMSLPSISENGEGYFLNSDRIAWYFDNYFQHGEDRLAASPLHMAMTGRLPATLVVSAGFDPLRDEALCYLDKLRAAGVPHQHLHFDDLVHAFLNMEELVAAECAQTYQQIAAFLDRY
ncbi:alpha/beta hydrolase [Aquitalea palustris]|uniref:Alpha/beta hydrolase n=1 Tax=Aquitalea palustris TaxID=2480983 RepID=A0A454JEW1_9NEIS|nr:alpha/beta hydrolase [Aquitalea palustris]RMC93824.1 alpha/beta hydrolase [Aquitalea palustris]